MAESFLQYIFRWFREIPRRFRGADPFEQLVISVLVYICVGGMVLIGLTFVFGIYTFYLVIVYFVGAILWMVFGAFWVGYKDEQRWNEVE